MAFAASGLHCVFNNGEAALYMYRSDPDATIAQIIADGYFDDVDHQLRPGDVILCVLGTASNLVTSYRPMLYPCVVISASADDVLVTLARGSDIDGSK